MTTAFLAGAGSHCRHHRDDGRGRSGRDLSGSDRDRRARNSRLSPILLRLCLRPCSAALSDRSQLPPFNRAFVGLIVVSIVGAGLGAALLVLTPERMFAQIVPLLLGFATLLFAVFRADQPLASRARRGAWPCQRVRFRQSESGAARLVLWRLFRRRCRHPDARRILAGDWWRLSRRQCRQNVISSLNGLAATLVFATQGAVLWSQTLALAAGTIGGGLIGAYVARIIPRNIVRGLVLAVGAALTIAFARRYWF